MTTEEYYADLLVKAQAEINRLNGLMRDQSALARANADLHDRLDRKAKEHKELQAQFSHTRRQAGTIIRALYAGMSDFDQEWCRAPSGMLMVDLDLPCETGDHAALVERAQTLSSYYESGAKM